MPVQKRRTKNAKTMNLAKNKEAEKRQSGRPKRGGRTSTHNKTKGNTA